MSTENWRRKDIPDLSGKVILVTGGNSGLGFEAVKTFARHSADVVLACRNAQKGETAKSYILKEYPQAKISVMTLDLADLQSVKEFTMQFNQQYGQLDVLLNNAGIMASPYALTKDGFESQMGINHLGHFALTGLLLPVILKTPDSRVVNVSSGAHKFGKFDFNNLLFVNGKGYTPFKAYARSKLANLLFTHELQRKFDIRKIKCMSVAAHPGIVRTNLTRYMENGLLYKILSPFAMIFTKKPQKGVLSLIRASVDSEVMGKDYFGPAKISGKPVLVEASRQSRDLTLAHKLWKESERLTGITYRF